MAQEQDRLSDELQQKVAKLLLDVIRSVIREVLSGSTVSDGETVETLQVGPQGPISSGAGVGTTPPAPASIDIAAWDADIDWPVRQEDETAEHFRQRVVQTQKLRQWIKAQEMEAPIIDLGAPPEPPDVANVPHAPIEPQFTDKVATGPSRVAKMPDPLSEIPEDWYDTQEEKERVYPTGHESYPIERHQERANEAMDQMFRSLNIFLERIADTAIHNKDRIDNMDADYMTKAS